MKTGRLADAWVHSVCVLATSLLLLPALAFAQPTSAEKEPAPAGAQAAAGAVQEWCSLPLCRDAEALRRTGDRQGALKLYRYIHDEVDVDEKVLRKELIWFPIAALYSELQQAQAGLEALQKYQLYTASHNDRELPAGQRREDTELLAQELRARQARVRIGTTVAGLRVRIDGRDVGVTPLASPLPVPTGHHRVELSNAPNEAQDVEVAAGQEVMIWPVPAAAPLSAPLTSPVTDSGRAPRPRWRIAVGSVGLGVGVTMIAVGAAALAADGQCASGTAGPCPIETNGSGRQVMRLVDGRATGGGLLAAGILLSAAGTVLVALPGTRLPLHATVAFHSGATLGLAAAF